MCAGSFLLDLGRRIAGHAKEYTAAAWAGGERSSSHASNEEERFFLYFSKSFFTEIYFRFHNLQIYTPTARLQGGRPPAGR